MSSMSDTRITRGNVLQLQKSHFKYDTCKFYFTNRVAYHWNSLPNWVITANNIKLLLKKT